jgi:hypothetical protein
MIKPFNRFATMTYGSKRFIHFASVKRWMLLSVQSF